MASIGTVFAERSDCKNRDNSHGLLHAYVTRLYLILFLVFHRFYFIRFQLLYYIPWFYSFRADFSSIHMILFIYFLYSCAGFFHISYIRMILFITFHALYSIQFHGFLIFIWFYWFSLQEPWLIRIRSHLVYTICPGNVRMSCKLRPERKRGIGMNCAERSD